MAYIVKMPNLGMSMSTGEVIEWYVETGDEIEEGNIVVEIEAEKTASEVEAKQSGTLRRVYAEVGDVAPPGAPLGIIAGADEEIDTVVAEAESQLGDIERQDADDNEGERPGSEPAEGTPGSGVGAVADTQSAAMAASEERTEPDSGSRRVTPRAKKRATELDVEVSDVTSGEVVTEDDIERLHERQTTAPQLTPRAKRRAKELGVDPDTLSLTDDHSTVTAEKIESIAGRESTTRTVQSEQELDQMRRQIADRLGESYREAVHVTVDRSIEAEALFDTLERIETEMRTDISIMDLLLRAVSDTLSDFPAFNATFEEGLHRSYEEHNIGVAVDIEGGLLTPVVSEVNTKTLSELSESRKNLITRVQSGEYDADDLAGGTFTVSNLGPLGVDSFTPIINPPEVAILGVGRSERKAVETADGISLQRHLNVSLSFDHRVVDGADAARFLDALAESVSEPATLIPDNIASGGGNGKKARTESSGSQTSAEKNAVTGHAGAERQMNNATVVVTGASRGIGKALAADLADAGAHVVMCARSRDNLNDVAESISDSGGDATAVQADVRDEDDMSRLMERAAEIGDKIDGVVANAGIYRGETGETPLSTESYDTFDDHLQTNVRGVFATVREAVPYLADDARILISSGSVARNVYPGFGSYAVSKAGAEAVAQVFSEELDHTVSVVDPGQVETELTGRQGHDPEDVAPQFHWALAVASNEAVDGEVIDRQAWRKAQQ
jgi:pyruvate dehydrogenase E2 component (dihydrolipoamide acetyltransferase)